MMGDRELLERAADAAGILINELYTDRHPPSNLPDGYLVITNASGGHSYWNPLNDNGDALRLAVRLNLQIDVMPRQTFIGWGLRPGEHQRRAERNEAHGTDPFCATRRAIVRAAAEIGKAKEQA